jgi:O-antigen/teichoic acid export membrane protein
MNIKSIIKRIFQNSLYLIFGRITSGLLLFLLIVIMANKFGAEGIGYYSMIIISAELINKISDLGLTKYSIKKIARNNEQFSNMFASIITTKFISTILFYLIFTLLIMNIFEEQYTKNLLILGGSLSIIFSLNYSLLLIFFAFEKMKFIFYHTLIKSAIIVMLASSLFMLNYNFSWLIISIFIGNLISFLFGYLILIYKFPKFKYIINFSLIKKIIYKSFWFWLISIIILLSFQLNTIMLFIMKGNISTGIYQGAYKILNNSENLIILFIVSMYPVFSKYNKISKLKLIKLYKKLKLITLILILLGNIIIFTISDFIITNIFPKEFIYSITILKLLLIPSSIILLSLLNTYYIFIIGKLKHLFLILFSGLILNILLNYIFILKWDYYGVIIGGSISFSIIYVFQQLYINNINSKITLTKLNQ